MEVRINGSTFRGEYGLLSDHDGTLVYGGEEAHTILVKKYFELLHIDPKLSEAGTSFSDLLKGQLTDQRLVEAIIELFYESRNLSFQKPSDETIKENLDIQSGEGADESLYRELRQASEKVIRKLRDDLQVCMFEDARRLVSQPHFPKKSCIVTGCPADIMSSNARFHGIDFSGSFKGAICADDKNGPQKPDPAPYIKGANLIDMAPSDCIALEDSFSGLLSAVRAGCISVFVHREAKRISEKINSLISEKGVIVIKSLDQVRFSN